MSKKITLSVVIITRNEELNIEDCLEGVKGADEIIVVDDASTDRTVELARRFTDRIYHHPMKEGFGKQKNFAINQAASEWILSLDADERVSPELWQEIISKVQDTHYNGFYLQRLTTFLGKPIYHCGWFEPENLRLFKNGSGRFNQMLVHESVLVDGEIGYISHPLIHDTYRDATHHLEKLNLYTSLNAEEFHSQGIRLKPVNYPWYFMLKPFLVFLRKYFLMKGFKDGLRGFFISALSAFQYFESYLKLWELQKIKKQIDKK